MRREGGRGGGRRREKHCCMQAYAPTPLEAVDITIREMYIRGREEEEGREEE